MTTKLLMSQLDGIGIARCLKPEQIEHVLCLLRIIEHLPMQSEIDDEENIALLRQRLKIIHQNHCELSKAASEVMDFVRAKNLDTSSSKQNTK